MEQRERFIRDDRLALYTMTELCDRYAISRETGYEWLERFDAGGRAGLSDRSRALHQCPHRITDHVAQLISLTRRQHPSWGPEKSCCNGCGLDIRTSSCRPSVPPVICWPARGW
jgi:hypothetical protein